MALWAGWINRFKGRWRYHSKPPNGWRHKPARQLVSPATQCLPSSQAPRNVAPSPRKPRRQLPRTARRRWPPSAPRQRRPSASSNRQLHPPNWPTTWMRFSSHELPIPPSEMSEGRQPHGCRSGPLVRSPASNHEILGGAGGRARCGSDGRGDGLGNAGETGEADREKFQVPSTAVVAAKAHCVPERASGNFNKLAANFMEDKMALSDVAVLRKAASYMKEHGHSKGYLENDKGEVCLAGAINKVLTGDACEWPARTNKLLR